MTSGLFARPWLTVLDAEPGLEVVGLAADGDAVVLAHRFSPDVGAMARPTHARTSTVSPQRNGWRASFRPALSVVLTTFADDSSILAAVEAGAMGFLTKDAGRDQIVLAVRSAAAGQSVVLDPGSTGHPSPRCR